MRCLILSLIIVRRRIFFEILDDKEYWIPFIEKYADRITYGTDSYNFEYDNEENWQRATGLRPLLCHNFFASDMEHTYTGKTYTGIGLEKKLLKKIFYDNLNEMLGEPNTIDYDYFVKKCEKLLDVADPNSLDRYNLWCMKHDFQSMNDGVFVLK